MTFNAEFAPEAIHLAAGRADRFGSAPAFLNRIMADAVAELQAVARVADCGTEWEKQFCGPRSREAFIAFNTAQKLLPVFAPEKELVSA